VLLIAKGDQIAVYINNQPAGYVQDSTFTNGELSLEWISASTDPVLMIVDNLKYWELKDENAPAWVTDFAQPLLDEIETRAPWFEEDFTAPDALWHFGQWSDSDGGITTKWLLLSDYIQDGTMSVDFGPNTYYFLNRDLGSNSNYLVQFDVTLQAGDPNTRFYFSPGKQMVWMYFLPDESWWGIGDTKDSMIYGNGYSTEIGSKPMRLLFIARGYEFAVFLNGVPLTHLEGNGKDDFHNLRFEFKSGNGRFGVTMDNLKYWLLGSS